MESLFLTLQSEQIRKPNSGGKEVSVLLKHGILFVSFIAKRRQVRSENKRKNTAKRFSSYS